MCPHDMTHVLPKMFSLNQSVLENIRQIHIEGHLAKIVWTLQKCFYQERQKLGVGGDGWRLKETEENLTARGNAWSLTGYWFEKK